MINIHEKMWVIRAKERSVDKEEIDVRAPNRIQAQYPLSYRLNDTNGLYYTFEFVRVNWKD